MLSAPFRSSSLSTIRIDHDSAGMLTTLSSICFLGSHSNNSPTRPSKITSYSSSETPSKATVKDSTIDNESVRQTHFLLRDFHRAIFDEQIFDMVNQEAFSESLGLDVIGMRENYLQLSIGPESAIFVSLTPANQDDQAANGGGQQQTLASPTVQMDSPDGGKLQEEQHDALSAMKSDFPNYTSYEIYLKQIFLECIFLKGKDKPLLTGGRLSGQSVRQGSDLLGHFCKSLTHIIFSSKVFREIENVVCTVPYLHLISHPTWHSRTSSWIIFLKIPNSILHSNSRLRTSDDQRVMKATKSEFRTKIAVNDDRISIEAEGAPNVVGLFNSSYEGKCSTNKYDSHMANLPVIILQQVASQVNRCLHDEALTAGIKANRNFLCLSFELEQGEILSLLAHVDPKNTHGCISWWLVMEDGFAEERKLNAYAADDGSDYRKFLGYLPLDVLHSTLMDLVSLCTGSGNF